MFVNLILCEIFVKGVAVIMSICFISHMHVVRWQITVRVTDGSMTAQGRALVGGNIYAYSDSASRKSAGRRTPTPPRKFFSVAVLVALGQNQSRDQY